LQENRAQLHQSRAATGGTSREYAASSAPMLRSARRENLWAVKCRPAGDCAKRMLRPLKDMLLICVESAIEDGAEKARCERRILADAKRPALTASFR